MHETTEIRGTAQGHLDPRGSIPEELLDRGLTDAHHYPLVGERRGGSFRATRVNPSHSWWWPHVELRTATSYTAVVVDIDREDALREAVEAGTVPHPSTAVERHVNGHAHAAWFLRAPVHRYPHARPKPLLKLARVADYFTEATQADPGFTGVMMHNPAIGRLGFRRWFDRDGPGWSLGDLAAYVPKGWKRPARRLSGVGRNCDTFMAALRWAGRSCNRGRSVWEAALAFNGLNEPPLAESELRGIVRSVERYRARWEARGWHRPSWIARQAARGRLGGRLSGERRRSAVRDRDEEIVAARAAGMSLRAIAADFGLTEGGVRYVLNRGA